MLSRWNILDVLKAALLVLILCFLITVTRRFVIFLISAIAIYLVLTKYKIVTPEKTIGLVILSLVCYYVVFPGIALHLTHKISSQNFDSAIHYVIDRTKNTEHVSVWNATALHDCNASVMHDFHMSEIFHFYRIKNVTFIPGPQYSRDDCAKAVREFRHWQTIFFPDALKAYGEDGQNQLASAMIFVPESRMDELQSILRNSGRDYKVAFSSGAGKIWPTFFQLIRRISKISNDSPVYLVLEPSF